LNVRHRLQRTRKILLIDPAFQRLFKSAYSLDRYPLGLGYLASAARDVLDAQRQLFDAEIGLTRIQRSQLAAVVQVYKALGEDWTLDSHRGMSNIE